MGLANAGKGRNTPEFDDASKVSESKSTESKGITSIDDVVTAVTNAPKGKPKKQISIYLDLDVAREFDRFAKKNGKGSKSRLINKFLRQALQLEEDTD